RTFNTFYQQLYRKSEDTCNNLLVVNLSHVLDEHQQLVGVAPLVVVPRNNLYKGVGQLDASLSVEDRGASIAQEVGGDNVLVGVTQDALQAALRQRGLGSLLHRSADLVVGCRLREVAGQVNNGNVQGRNTHGHTGQLAV